MRKIIPALLALSLLAALLGAAEPAVKKDVLDKHAKELAAIIPSGWTVRVDPEGDGIWIERKDPVPMHSTAPNQGAFQPGQSPEMGRPTLFLRAAPPRTEADLAAMIKQNADRAKVLEMLASQMKDMLPTIAVVPSSGDEEDYRADTPEQRARLDAFVAVKKALPYQELPELFADDATFNWTYFYLQPAEESIQAEQERIRLIAESAFSKKPLK